MSDNTIRLAEKKWKSEIIQYVSKLHIGQWLPSHDIDHHCRVWKNACELSSETVYPSQDEYFYEKLLLAVFFHDTGLLKDRGENHGRLSREFCEDFLSQNEEYIHFDTGDLLDAIEYHDDKTYGNNLHTSSNNIYLLLTIADDLDALGAIGTYRYVEIYSLRKLQTETIPTLILNNLNQRYDYFKASKYASEMNQTKYRAKYNTIISLLIDDSFSEDPLTLIRWINDEIIIPQKDPFQYIWSINTEGLTNKRIRSFISEFSLEHTDS